MGITRSSFLYQHVPVRSLIFKQLLLSDIKHHRHHNYKDRQAGHAFAEMDQVVTNYY